MKNIYKIEENIYITDNSEIKAGDCTIHNGKIKKATLSVLAFANEFAKKIILTTDQDLIKDGIQPIDDEFLEWFVKNPSCEFVEVGKTNKLIDNYAEKDEDKWEVKYHIYIPKEEPKQETTIEEIVEKLSMEDAKKLDTFLNGMKYQEKIKQEDYGLLKIELSHTKTLLASCEKALEERDKQQNIMYSEEEVLQLLLRLKQTESYENLYDWFDQHKKK
jgi:hypothetical protein